MNCIGTPANIYASIMLKADVLYISFQHPQKVTNTVVREDGLLLRYRDEQLVGITVLDASTRD